MGPLVSAEVSLKDFAYMPLDVVRLRDADVTCIATGDEFRAAVLLWCASWHQQPAASLPNDDRVLANMAGFGRDIESWKVVKDMAIRGFVLCDDGRLYHPVIAEKAIESWSKKKAQRERTAAATASRNHGAQRDVNRDVQRNVDQVKVSKGKRSKGNKEEGASAPEWISTEAINAFREYRQKIRKPLTAHAESLLIRELTKLRDQGHNPTECLNRAILNGWLSPYPPKPETKHGKQTNAQIAAQSVAHAFTPLPSPALQD